MIVDSKKHNPDPAYLRGLIIQAGISQREAARRIGVDERLFRMYLTDRANSTAQNCTYAVQFCLEVLSYTERLNVELDVCHWKQVNDQDNNGEYDTDCGEGFMISEETPEANNMRYCCYCGKKLIQILL